MSELSPRHAELLATVPLPDGARIETADLEYQLDETALQGYLAFDAASTARRPGVLVVHDWGGVGQYVEVRAQMLARLGYVAVAPDIYGAGVRPVGHEAAQVAGRYHGDRALMRARIRAGLDQLRAHPLVDPERIAAIGYCFGGSVALELARSGADIAGVVSFHGVLTSPAPPDATDIRARVLVLTGAADPVVPDEQVAEFMASMRAVPELDWQLVHYSGAMHSFSQPEANAPTHGAVYQANADRRSWAAMRAFFDEIFG